MPEDPDKLTIGALAQAVGINVETVRYYQRRRLLPTPPRRLGGFRYYELDHVRRLRFIRRAQALGFSLEEIGRLLSLEREQTCATAQALASTKLALVRDRLRDLGRLESTLQRLVDQCAASGGRVTCPIIASLGRESKEPAPVGATHSRASGSRTKSRRGA